MLYSFHTVNIRGQEFVFRDVAGSHTVPVVTDEMNGPDYGLEKITLTPNDTVLDVGANVGMFSIYMRKTFGCKVIAFEPVKQNFENFKANLILNGLTEDDIELHNCAITDKDGDIVTIKHCVDNMGGSSAYIESDVIEECPTESLRKYITPDCKYLKLDCEGAEFVIIPDILDLLNTFQYIGIEYHEYTNHLEKIYELHNTVLDNYENDLFFVDYHFR